MSLDAERAQTVAATHAEPLPDPVRSPRGARPAGTSWPAPTVTCRRSRTRSAFRITTTTDRKEYAHPAAIALASPDGKIARYLYGLEYDPKTLRLGLVEASEGKIGTTLDRLILYCFHYDSTAAVTRRSRASIMQLGGAVAVVMLVAILDDPVSGWMPSASGTSPQSTAT